VIDPDSAGDEDADAEVAAGAALVAAGALLLDELLLEEQAASVTAVIEASPRAIVVTVIRRIHDSLSVASTRCGVCGGRCLPGPVAC
jgi:hypothetical protein